MDNLSIKEQSTTRETCLFEIYHANYEIHTCETEFSFIETHKHGEWKSIIQSVYTNYGLSTRYNEDEFMAINTPCYKSIN